MLKSTGKKYLQFYAENIVYLNLCICKECTLSDSYCHPTSQNCLCRFDHNWLIFLSTGTLTNSEDCDEIPWHVTFHPDLHCLLKLKQSTWTETYLKMIT